MMDTTVNQKIELINKKYGNEFLKAYLGYRIGIGKFIEVFYKEMSDEVQKQLTSDAKPFQVWFYERKQ